MILESIYCIIWIWKNKGWYFIWDDCEINAAPIEFLCLQQGCGLEHEISKCAPCETFERLGSCRHQLDEMMGCIHNDEKVCETGMYEVTNIEITKELLR